MAMRYVMVPCWAVCVQCMPPAYLPLHCSNGECGRVLSGEPEMCPLPCSIHDQCVHCLATPGCGWCALGGQNGLGVCMEGGLMMDTTHGQCVSGKPITIYDEQHLDGQ